MPKQMYDFSAMAVIDPSVPPAGMRLWNKSNGSGKIIEAGMTLSTLNSFVAWVAKSFTPTKRYVKLEMKIASTLGNGRYVGIFFSKDDTATTVESRLVGSDASYSVERPYSNLAPGGTLNRYIGFRHVAGDIITVYLDTVKNVAYPFKNGKCVLKPIEGLVDHNIFGVVNVQSNSTPIEYFSIESIDTIPLYAGEIMSTNPVTATQRGFNLSGVANYFRFNGFKPKYCTLLGYNLPVNIISADKASVNVNLDKWLGQVVTLTDINLLFAQTITLGDGVVSTQSNCLIESGFQLLVKITANDFGDSTRLGFYYNIHGSGIGLPAGSILINGNELADANNAISLNSDGWVYLTSPSGTGIINRTVYIVDGIDSKLRKMSLSFNLAVGTNLSTAFVYGLSPTPNAFNVNPNEYVESAQFDDSISLPGDNLYILVNGQTGDSLTYVTGNVQLSCLVEGVWSEWVDITGPANQQPFESITYKFRIKSANKSNATTSVTLNNDLGDLLGAWEITTKIDDTISTAQSYDFSAMTIASPANPPAGMRKWTKSTGIAAILDSGFGRAVGSTTPVAWIADNFVPKGRYFKMSYVVGITPAGIVNQGVGFFLAKHESLANPTGQTASAFLTSPNNSKTATLTGDTIGVVINTTNRIQNIVSGDVFDLYIDTATGLGQLYHNGVCIKRTVSIDPEYVNFGVVSNTATGSISSFTIADVDTVPAFVGLTAGTTNIDLGKPFLVNYFGIDLKFCEVAGVQADVDIVEPGLAMIKPPAITSLLNLPYELITTPAGLNVAYVVLAKFFNYTSEVSLVDSPQFNGANLVVASSGAGQFENPLNLNGWYRDESNVRASIPDGSIIISPQATASVDKVIIGTNGSVTIQDMVAGSSAFTTLVYIQTPAGQILTQHQLVMNRPSGVFVSAGKINIAELFVTKFNQPVNQYVESNVIEMMDAGQAGAEFFSDSHIEISWGVDGGGWSAWTPIGPSTIASPVSTVDPLPVKLRMVSPNISYGIRTVTLKEESALGYSLPWTVQSAIDETPFIPDLTEDPEEVLVDLINHENGTQLTGDDVDVSQLNTYTGIRSNNTVATIVAVPNRPVSGTINVGYSRINIAGYKNSSNVIPVKIPLDGTWEDVIAAINVRCKLNLTEDDYIANPSFPGMAGGTVTQTLTIETTSLLYTGTASIEISVLDQPLSNWITDTELKGMIFPYI